jgi:hypothetical protein
MARALPSILAQLERRGASEASDFFFYSSFSLPSLQTVLNSCYVPRLVHLVTLHYRTLLIAMLSRILSAVDDQKKCYNN